MELATNQANNDYKYNSLKLIEKIKEDDQDFEFYPTTQEIINKVKKHIGEHDSILDIGAGDGRVLMELTRGRKYAIEKAVPLINAMNDEIVIIGTDFWESTLIDKEVKIIFCNPPYSTYQSWATKIINEGNCKSIILVIPERWKESQSIQEAIKKREGVVMDLGSFDFLKADRQSRAKVNIVKILLGSDDYYHRLKTDPFNIWFDEEFKFQEQKTCFKSEYDCEYNGKTELKDQLKEAVTKGKGKIPFLVELYNHEMKHLHNNFKLISGLDGDILAELGTKKENIKEALKKRIIGLKNKYWKELFDNLKEITSRLTSKSRKDMLEKLNSQTNVDFTESNIYAVLIWVIKNANKYFDNQLIQVVEEMISKANIKNYKSNQRVYEYDDWRYRNDKDLFSHYGLELRIIIEHWGGGISNDGYDGYHYTNKLCNRDHDFINDLITIAINLGYRIPEWENSYHKGDWESNKAKTFEMALPFDENNLYRKRSEFMLMQVKAFKNGNLHIKFRQEFIKRLNVEFGRLKGWLKDKYQAADELNITVEESEQSFNCNKQLNGSILKLLTDGISTNP